MTTIRVFRDDLLVLEEDRDDETGVLVTVRRYDEQGNVIETVNNGDHEALTVAMKVAE